VLDPSQINKSTSTIIKRAPPPKNSFIKKTNIASNIRKEIKKNSFSNTYAARAFA